MVVRAVALRTADSIVKALPHSRLQMSSTTGPGPGSDLPHRKARLLNC